MRKLKLGKKFERVRYIGLGSQSTRPWAFETIVMAALLEHEKRMEEMMRRIEELTASSRS